MPGGDPRKLAETLSRLLAEEAPKTLLAEIQTGWRDACGPAIADASEPVAEREGTVTIACQSGAWSQELEMMHDVLLSRVEAIVGEGRVAKLRFTADLARHR